MFDGFVDRPAVRRIFIEVRKRRTGEDTAGYKKQEHWNTSFSSFCGKYLIFEQYVRRVREQNVSKLTAVTVGIGRFKVKNENKKIKA